MHHQSQTRLTFWGPGTLPILEKGPMKAPSLSSHLQTNNFSLTSFSLTSFICSSVVWEKLLIPSLNSHTDEQLKLAQGKTCQRKTARHLFLALEL